jgi:transcriptional regulator with XRE-family HTH domain
MPPRGYTIKRGRFLREMKKQKIANGNQLAVQLGMHRSTVGEVLSGKALAGPAFAMAACRVFGLEHGDLFADVTRTAPKAKAA